MMRHRSRPARFFGVAAITVGAIAVGLAIGAVASGLAEGGFHGALVGLVYAALIFSPAVPLVFLGRRVLRKARSSN